MKQETKNTENKKAMNTKQFNFFFDEMVANRIATQDQREEVLQKMISSGAVKIGRGSYTEAQQFVVNKFNDSIDVWIAEAEKNGLTGVNKGILKNALGIDVDIALNMKSVKATK